MRRMKVRSMQIKVIDKNTGEILTIYCKPEELPRTMEIFNTLNNMGQFAIEGIYATGQIEKSVVGTSTQVVYVKEET